MLKRLLVTTAVAVFLGFGLAAEAQQSAIPESQATEPRETTAGSKIHLEGCLYPERALSAAKPVIVPAGSVEPYVLTDTKHISGEPRSDEARVFALHEVAPDRLRALNGKRVGVTGRVAEQTGMPALHVISLREIVGACPAVPTSSHS